jgi:hypothetical protein
MARLQILELPAGPGDDQPPFILVIDQVDNDTATDIASWPNDISKRLGARHVLCFPGTIDIPANDTTAYLGGIAHPQIEGQDLAGETQPTATWTKTDSALADLVQSVRTLHGSASG